MRNPFKRVSERATQRLDRVVNEALDEITAERLRTEISRRHLPLPPDQEPQVIELPEDEREDANGS